MHDVVKVNGKGTAW